MYKTEGELGTGIKESSFPREKLFVTTKVDNANIHNIKGAIETSLKKLQLDYVDLCVNLLVLSTGILTESDI